MNTHDLKSRILPALLAGTRRESHPSLAALAAARAPSALDALSLTGQALRFERPSMPHSFAVEQWPEDARPIIPDDVRRLLLRFLSLPMREETSESAIAWAIARKKVRPHPFDLPKMEGFVHRQADHLGVTARYWVQRHVPAAKNNNYFDPEDISEKNWTDFPAAPRTRFLEVLRARDATAGRNLLATAWGSESAEMRLQLLGALQAGLSLDDKPFLESAAKDRAPRVKTLAQRLLARLTGDASDNPALAACLERIERAKGGLLKKRVSLKLQLPATVKERNANRWILEQFSQISLDEMAKALELPVDDLAGAADKDDHLLFALAMMASQDKRFDMLDAIAKRLPDAWERMRDAGFVIDFVDDGERARWVETMVRPNVWMPDAAVPAWTWLLHRMEEPLPDSLMQSVLASKWWETQLAAEDKPDEELAQLFCALCPRAIRNKLREQLEGLDPGPREYGKMLLEILDRLETL